MCYLVVQVDRSAVKRKYDDCVEVSEVSGSEIDEETDEEEASSSDCDASEYESPYNKRRKTQRFKVEEDEEELLYVDELKEMQLLLELQLNVSIDYVHADANVVGTLVDVVGTYVDVVGTYIDGTCSFYVQASERREARMKQRMEAMMELMSRHVGHVEKRVFTMEDGSQPQEQILERINVKLEQLMEGFSTLNENLSILSACLSRDLDSQR